MVTPVACVGGVVFDATGRLLLILRGHDPGAGLWSVPGGRVEAGETPLAAVVREVREETGVDVTPVTLLGTVVRGDYVIDDFLCVLTDGDRAVTATAGDDAADAAWFTARQIGSLPMVEGLLDALRTWEVLPPEG